MYDAAGDRVGAVGMPAKSGGGGGIAAVLPGQLGIGVYSALLDEKGDSVRWVKVLRSLSQELGLHFLTVSRESRSTIRAVYHVDDGLRVYEVHGDLLFAAAEQVLRSIDRDSEEFAVVILDVSQLDSINDPARAMLLGLSAQLGGERTPGCCRTAHRRRPGRVPLRQLPRR